MSRYFGIFCTMARKNNYFSLESFNTTIIGPSKQSVICNGQLCNINLMVYNILIGVFTNKYIHSIYIHMLLMASLLVPEQEIT